MSMVAWGMKDIEKINIQTEQQSYAAYGTVAGAFGTALAAMLM